MNRWLPLSMALLALGSCTDVDLYASDGTGVPLKDRISVEGTVCSPLPAGKQFPVKVMFLLDASGDATSKAAIIGAVQKVFERFASSSAYFGVIAFHHAAASLVPAGFDRGVQLSTVPVVYSNFKDNSADQTRSLVNALDLARALISGDMSTSCAGLVSRTRYLVVLVTTGAHTAMDSACNSGTATANCKASMGQAACESCMVSESASAVRALADRFQAGELVIEPFYLHTGAPDPVASAQLTQLSIVAGAPLVDSDYAGAEAKLVAVDYRPLTRRITRKLVLAYNRNARAIDGAIKVDSDGDGIPDEDEIKLGTDPLHADTDLDGLSDKVELVAGMNPLSPDTVAGCDPLGDADHDGLTDCEEKILGSNPCMGDTDADGVPDLIEFLAGTDFLRAEGTRDDDADGIPNLDELRAHTDPRSADVRLYSDKGYTYREIEAPDNELGQSCTEIHVSNISLVATKKTDEHPEGQNDIYVYVWSAPADQREAPGIGRLSVYPVIFVPPDKHNPPGPSLFVNDEDFELKP